jgi:hypothetical protein
MASPLYAQHPESLAATYADIENHALNQESPVSGTPGALTVRQNANGTRFYVRQYYDFDGRKRDQYLGQADTAQSEALAATWKGRIEEAKQLRDSVRLLAREGYCLLGPKAFAAITPLAAHGLFRAGAMLLGTHAFEVVVNRLGIRTAAFATEDVDIARPTRLSLANPPEGGLLGLLRQSGIDFVDVPRWEHGAPATSYKERGRSRFTFDLLVPAAGKDAATVGVPELAAHASALPYLRYLVSESQTGAVISTHGAVAVRVPLPERLALHKLIVSELRAGRPQKSRKDRQQAAILIAALGELQPGALEAAFAKTAVSTRRHIRNALALVREDLQAHPRAWEEVAAAAKIS